MPLAPGLQPEECERSSMPSMQVRCERQGNGRQAKPGAESRRVEREWEREARLELHLELEELLPLVLNSLSQALNGFAARLGMRGSSVRHGGGLDGQGMIPNSIKIGRVDSGLA